MTTNPKSPVRVLLLREVATGPVAAAFVAERWTREGSGLAVVKVLRDPMPAERIVPLHETASQLSTLRHRHIVCVDQVVEIDGHFGLIAPYVDGIDLLDWVSVLRENGRRMPTRVVCEVLRATAVALDAALHRVPYGEDRALRLAHGDLKPTNIMIDRDGELKVLDFGTGSTRLAVDDPPLMRSALTYLAPERRQRAPAAPAADVYALGILGIELLTDRWLHNTPQEQDAHDAHLTALLERAPLELASGADETTMRGLVAEMVAYDPSIRPSAAAIAQTFRRLADRCTGPSLESFAHEAALPHLTNAPENPDTGLMVQVTPISVDLDFAPPEQGPPVDEDTATMGAGDIRRMFEEEAPKPAFLVDSQSWLQEEGTLTDQVADETEKALEAARQARKLDLALDPDSMIPFMEDEDEGETEKGRGAGIPTLSVPDPRHEPEEVEAEVVFAPEPARPNGSRPWMWAVVAASLTGALIALCAVLLGLLVGVYLTLSL